MSAKKKTEKPAEQKYTITLSKRQLRLLRKVCESWARMCMGQTQDMAEDLAWLHYEYKPDDPGFDKRILRRDACKEMLELAMRAASGGNLEHYQKTEDVRVVLDMYSVIRNFFWHQLPEDERARWTVDADPVYIWGPEPKIIVKKEGQDDV